MGQSNMGKLLLVQEPRRVLQPTGYFPRYLWGEGIRMKSQPLLLSEGRS